MAALKYDEEYGFIGRYIVKPQYRGKGYGYKVWQKAMERVKNINL